MTSREPLAYEHSFPEGHLDLDAIKVVNRLERFGHVAYFVGGCLRDLLLGIRPKDYDLVTSATPRQVKKLFRNSRIIGRRFKLVHVVFGGKIIELSTFRGTSDTSSATDETTDSTTASTTDNAAPLADNTVEPQKDDSAAPATDSGKSLLIRSDNDFGTAQEDAVRRDFTINALYYNQERKQIIDYVGGIEDLKARRLATIGDPETRFREDPVRMIRAIKLQVKLNLNVDDEIIEKIKEFHPKLLNSSSPRVLEEVYKLLECGASSEIFEKLYEFGVFGTILKPFEQKLKDCCDGVAPLVNYLSKLDTIMDDSKTPSKPLCLATMLLPVVENVFNNPDLQTESDNTDTTTSEAVSAESASSAVVTEAVESSQSEDEAAENQPEVTEETADPEITEQVTDDTSQSESTAPSSETEENDEDVTTEAVLQTDDKKLSNYISLSRESVTDFLHQSHALSGVSRRDREDTVRLLENLSVLHRNNDSEIRSLMRKSSFSDAFRLFSIGVASTGKFTEQMSRLKELTKDYDFNQQPHEHRRYRNKPRRYSRGRSR